MLLYIMADLVGSKFLLQLKKKTKRLVLCSFWFIDGDINYRQLQGSRWVGSEVTTVKELFGFLEPHSSLSITGLMQPLVLLFRLEKDQLGKGKSILKRLQISNYMYSDCMLECTLTQHLGLKVRFLMTGAVICFSHVFCSSAFISPQIRSVFLHVCLCLTQSHFFNKCILKFLITYFICVHFDFSVCI